MPLIFQYQFRVFGRNNIGDGKPIMAKNTCETAPKRPDKNPDEVLVKGVRPDRLLVSWKPMQREDWNGKNFHYLVKHRKVSLVCCRFFLQLRICC